jgi:hypothetical protein
MVVIMVVVVIMVTIVIAVPAPFAGFFEFVAALFRLPAAFAVLANRFLQVLFGFVDPLLALVVPVKCMDGQGAAEQQEAAEQG